MKTKFILAFFFIASNFVFGQGKEKTHKYKFRAKLPEAPKGIWEFYDFNGELDQKYDFTKQSLLYQKENLKQDTLKYKVISGKDTLLTKLDRPPLMVGGNSAWISTVVKLLRYPPDAVRNGIQGRAIISVIIDKNGKPIRYKSMNHIGGGIDEEAIRMMKLVPYGWIPAVLHGENVTTESTQYLTFKLE